MGGTNIDHRGGRRGTSECIAIKIEDLRFPRRSDQVDTRKFRFRQPVNGRGDSEPWCLQLAAFSLPSGSATSVFAFAADQFVDRAADLFRNIASTMLGGGWSLSSVARARLAGVMFSMSATIGVCRQLATHQT